MLRDYISSDEQALSLPSTRKVLYKFNFLVVLVLDICHL